ncbi:sigma-70 family RNA polymerase sigma factor [Lactobacillus sp. LC28-10]|uniref:Sigma-70 family RNA polymerase sigma factor n=1 Tax=Secundilactobacillus angelensis TaxID=2722706 RepID=A0ABX1KVK2_9LACO|nr:sigma-70 family RNA polymerase sigma factor [Secundilactobacillus angelensis]MCH5461657.1 sigma-70 family RNA polymerase sigma factor [Secundilactobacillus angelensis]NLR17952.1 sigma-70 family RNA polymerase sigma factor [Secundilactobacillus angelensis]
MDRTAQTAFDFLAEGDHELIIYSALKKLGIRQNDANFEDLVQEGWLLFVVIYQKYPQEPADSPKQFLAYAHQALYRRFLNQLQAQQRETKHLETGEVDLSGVPQTLDVLADTIDMELLTGWLEKCNEAERRFLIDRIYYQMTPSEISKKWGVSRQTIYKWQKHIRSKLVD